MDIATSIATESYSKPVDKHGNLETPHTPPPSKDPFNGWTFVTVVFIGAVLTMLQWCVAAQSHL